MRGAGLEGFHIPYIHQGLVGTLDYGAYTVETQDWSVLQLGMAKPGEPAFELPRSHPDHGRPIAAYYYWLFPTTMFNAYDRGRYSPAREGGVHHFHRLLAASMSG